MIDSIKKSFVLCGKALKLFYILAGVQVVTNLVNLVAVPGPDAPEMTLGRSLLVLLLTAAVFLIAIFVQGGALAFVRDLIKNGAADIKDLIDNCVRYFGRMLLLTFFLMIIGIVAILLASLVFAVLPGILKVILGILFGLAFMVFLVMPAYVLVGGDLIPVAKGKNLIETALNFIKQVFGVFVKGLIMAKDNFVQILVFLAILIGVGIAAFLIASLVAGLLSVILPPLAKVATAVLIGIVNAAVTILANIAFMDLYLKKRTGGNPVAAPGGAVT